jgi:predicted dehydrogenase
MPETRASSTATRRTTRREFLRESSLAGFGMLLAGSSLAAAGKAPSEKLAIGVIGTQNRAAENIEGVRGQSIVALCDVDDRYLEARARELPHASKHHDFRKLLDEKGIDAVVISTPDHVHAPATAAALRSGRHVYCEKPLTHSVYEARVVAQLAKEHKRATQLGTQIHAGSNYRRVVEVIQSGAIGAVREVHVWVEKSWSGGDRPPPKSPPPHVHYDLWVGPAPWREYHDDLLPQDWRRWWDFGGGTLSDMGCHHIDLSHWALDLRYPIAVEAEGPPVHPDGAPKGLVVRWDYPARGDKPPVRLTWYDGGEHHRLRKERSLPPWGDGTLFVGEKGMLLADYGKYRLLPEETFRGFQPPPSSIPDSVGHYEEWIRACKAGSPTTGQTTCNFDYSGALTESVLLGNVAYRCGTRIEWDAEKLEVKNAPAASRFVRREYRKGWVL